MTAEPTLQRIAARAAELGGGMQIRRALPTAARRLIGAWCFLDHFGPADIAASRGLRVGPHPHIGLQTVTWLLDGEVLHRDSLGNLQLIRPGQLNLMTSGLGIAHSEESPEPHPASLHGLQLWIALPDAVRRMSPAFHHYPSLPSLQRDGITMTLVVGEAFGERSPATVHSQLLGLDLLLAAGARCQLPLRGDFEYGLVVTQGTLTLGGETLHPGTLLYLGGGRDSLAVHAERTTHAFLIGGLPLGEPVLMWWNFVARSRAEIEQATDDWNRGALYLGTVAGYDGPRLSAPVPPWQSAGPDAVVTYP